MATAALSQPADHSIAYHETLKADPARWAELEFCGTVRYEADETGPAVTLVYKTCSCHSTLAALAVELA